jgi:transposase InsO family protein
VQTKSTKEGRRLTQDDVLYRFRLRVLAAARELGSVSAACRLFGVHRSSYYRWKSRCERYGLEILRPRERRTPRMPNAVPLVVEQRVVAFALGHPGFGPARISAELALERWGGLRVSPNGVWRILRRHGLNTRARRLALVAGYAAPPEPATPAPQPERQLETAGPGDLVQLDCFYVGRLQGTRGVVWQYTAIDVFSGFTWAELHLTPRNPAASCTSRLAQRVAADLARYGWRLNRVMTDNASEFRSHDFGATVTQLGGRQVFIRAGRPQTNGCVERVQRTILEECWKPSFARALIPKLRGLERDLTSYLDYYNFDRAHTGRWTRGRTPATVLGAAKVWR